jgi:hypothetical protein
MRTFFEASLVFILSLVVTALIMAFVIPVHAFGGANRADAGDDVRPAVFVEDAWDCPGAADGRQECPFLARQDSSARRLSVGEFDALAEGIARCPFLALRAAASGCPFLAARAASSGCPMLSGPSAGEACPYLAAGKHRRQPAGEPRAIGTRL